MDSLVVSHCYKNATKKSDADNEKNFKATCKFCPNRIISGNINNSSNFLKHIQEQHSSEFKKFQSLKAQSGSRKRKNDIPLETVDSRVVKKQTTMPLNIGISTLAQKDFDSALCYMITTDMQPLAIINRKGFRAFCDKVAPQCVLPSRRTLGRHISRLYTEEKAINKYIKVLFSFFLGSTYVTTCPLLVSLICANG